MSMVSAEDMLAAVLMKGRGEPYYICAPPYVPTSAGIRVLHLLAHLLNISGERAWLYIPDGDNTSLAPHLAAHLLTPAVLALHKKERCKPIVVHPETFDTPLNLGSLEVGYALNFPGHLNGLAKLDKSHFNIAYAEELFAETEHCRGLLYIPASDPHFFSPPTDGVRREGVAAYAGKYVDVHGGRVGRIPDLREVIHRDEQISPEKLRLILQRRRAIYVYENTAIATEALLCGCAVVRIRNPYFDKIISGECLGSDGYVDITVEAQGIDQQTSISNALLRTAVFRQNYLHMFSQVGPQLAKFIDDTQERAKVSPPASYLFPARESSKLEGITNKLHQWAISIRQLGWKDTLMLGIRRKFEQVANHHT